MATNKGTWDYTEVSSYLTLEKKSKKSEEAMLKNLFYDVLENDLDSTKKLAKAQLTSKESKQLQKDLKAFVKTYEKMRESLLKVTKKSNKY